MLLFTALLSTTPVQ
uniref:Uncharacterized protein n=1 Tax=Arundo donax TaxID=35708 RepID=A0A0A9AJC6_ARUDO